MTYLYATRAPGLIECAWTHGRSIFWTQLKKIFEHWRQITDKIIDYHFHSCCVLRTLFINLFVNFITKDYFTGSWNDLFLKFFFGGRGVLFIVLAPLLPQRRHCPGTTLHTNRSSTYSTYYSLLFHRRFPRAFSGTFFLLPVYHEWLWRRPLIFFQQIISAALPISRFNSSWTFCHFAPLCTHTYLFDLLFISNHKLSSPRLTNSSILSIISSNEGSSIDVMVFFVYTSGAVR